MLLCEVCLLTLLILVFVALTQHLIQSTMSTMKCENSTLLCIKWPFAPPRGRLLYYAFHFVGLAVHQSV